MTQESLKQPYSRKNWQTWLSDIFGSLEVEAQAENVEIDHDNIKSVQRFATVKLADGKNLAVLDIETRANVKIARNRVGLRNLVEKFIDHYRYHGILAFYHSDSSTGAVAGEYRLSFISSEPKIDADGKFVVESTASKRFTYLLGENAKTKTPADRLKAIAEKRGKTTLDDVKNAFSVETLTKEFYSELFEWYQWAEKMVAYPNNKDIEEHLIRLITRLMFVWFIKQKNLIPDDIFDDEKMCEILKDFDPASETDGNYYNAILQNLFFATLNRPVHERTFTADKSFQGKNEHYGIKTLFRDNKDETWFKQEKDIVLEMFKTVPFLNGGLFECLDRETDGTGVIQYYDGFSREKRASKRAFVPNRLFFDNEKGLISTLKRYNFTIEENTPNDVDVALDPELLGKVFENLLGAYNPETRETARKQSGSFYTPREIVNYMVDESLVAYLKQTVGEQYENEYRKLFTEETEMPQETKLLIYNALRNCKILDPACGSGAFPMGILNRIICMMEHLGLPAFISIFDMKLHLIENCIFGIDIQNIAVQISKLRFFISLIVEQTPSGDIDNNYGIKPLPNLETKFVAANTLIGVKHQEVRNLFEDPQIEITKNELLHTRRRHFMADTPKVKKACREDDEKLRKKLASLLEANGSFAPEDAKQLAAWNPYDQNASSPFFDAEWMFGVKEGFDVVIGNPPYVNLKRDITYSNFITFQCLELYAYFFEKGIDLLKQKGINTFITGSLYIKGVKFQPLRNFLTENTKLLHIKNEGDKIFENVKMPTSVFIGQKDKNAKWKFEDINIEFYLLKKIDENTVSISKISKMMRGLEFGRDKINDIGEIPFISGSNVCKYGITKLSYIDNITLNDFKKEKAFFENERILIRETGSEITSLYLDNLLYSNRSLYSILIIDKRFDAKFVLGCLNSKVLQFYYQTKFKAETDLFPKIRIIQAKELPIPIIEKSQQKQIITLVNQILTAKNENPAADASELEGEIDRLVYGLYGLTEEEIGIIENK